MNTPDVGEARETIPVKYTGKEISVAFNPEYMMDPLKNLTNDEISIELTDELSPGVIKMRYSVPVRPDADADYLMAVRRACGFQRSVRPLWTRWFLDCAEDRCPIF